MMRRAGLALLAILLPFSVLAGGMPVKYKAKVTAAGSGSGVYSGVIFYAPFNDNSSPLQLYVGPGPLTFTDATDNTLPIESRGAHIVAGDTLRIATSTGNIDWTVGTMSATVSRDVIGSNWIFRADGNGYFIIGWSGAALHFYYGDLANHLSVASNDTNTHRVAASWIQGGAFCLTIDGATPTCGVQAGAPFTEKEVPPTTLDIGTSVGEELKGYARYLRIQNRALTNAELQTITR